MFGGSGSVSDFPLLSLSHSLSSVPWSEGVAGAALGSSDTVMEK